MLRRAFLATILAASGCRPVRRKTLPAPILPPDSPPPEPEAIIPQRQNPAPTPSPKVRVIVYLNAATTRVKVGCVNGVCQYRLQTHAPSEALRSGLLKLTARESSGWTVSRSPDDHFQIVEMTTDGRVRLADCPVAIRIVDGVEVDRASGNLTAAWLTKWYHGEAPKLSKRYYPRRTQRHIGVSGETWQRYYDHLCSGHRLADVGERLRHHALDSLKNIHDDCHYGHVDRSLI